MKRFENTILQICMSNKDRNIIIYEHRNNQVSESLDSLNINYKAFDDMNNLINIETNDLLIILVDQYMIGYDDIYKKIGSIILNHPNHIIIINKIKNSEYLDNQMHKLLISLGFNLFSQTNYDNIFFLFYTYNIGSYKKTPDWLNSDNWANPDLWEK